MWLKMGTAAVAPSTNWPKVMSNNGLTTGQFVVISLSHLREQGRVIAFPPQVVFPSPQVGQGFMKMKLPSTCFSKYIDATLMTHTWSTDSGHSYIQWT